MQALRRARVVECIAQSPQRWVLFLNPSLAFRLRKVARQTLGTLYLALLRPCEAESRVQPPGNTFLGFDDPWQPGGAAAAAVEALQYPVGATPEQCHLVRIDLATAYLRVTKRLRINLQQMMLSILAIHSVHTSAATR